MQYVDIKNVTLVKNPTNITAVLILNRIEKKNNGTYLCISEDGTKKDKIELVVQSIIYFNK